MSQRALEMLGQERAVRCDRADGDGSGIAGHQSVDCV